MKNILVRAFGVLIIGVGAALYAFPGLIPSTTPLVTPALIESTVVPTPPPAALSGKPVSVAIPSVGIDVAVTSGYYDAEKNAWTVAPKQANYAVSTPLPNNKTGNTFIYGHNNYKVFTRLLETKIGEEAVITTENGLRFTYKLASVIATDPTNTEILAQTEKPTLTMQTCSGLWYQDRSIYRFEFVKVERI